MIAAVHPSRGPLIPLARNIVQVGIVVRDLDAALQNYSSKLGVGPWRVSVYGPPRLTNCKVRGVSVPYSMRTALAWTEEMNWELVQPIDGPSIYWEFLREHGEGLHHIMIDFGARTLAEVTAEFTARGWPPLMEGCFMGLDYVYYDTEADLKTIVEVRRAPPGWQRPEPDAWYPRAPAPL